jgi:hypothetical protein
MISRMVGVAVGCAALVAASAVSAGAGPDFGRWDRQGFLGLWEGVDPLDGSVVQLSITDLERDAVLELVMTESFFTNCAKLGPDYALGRGIITGEGRVVSKRVLVGGGRLARGVLATETTFTCFTNDGAAGTQLEGEFEYRLEDGGRILLIPGANEQTPDVLLHRMAR